MAETFTTTFGSRPWALAAQQGCDVAMLSERLAAARSVGDLIDLLTRMVRALLQADGATFVVREGDRCRYADEDAVAPLWQRVLAWWLGPARPPDLPDFLREDVGLPPRPTPYDRRGIPHHPVDVTILHGWRR